jgi:hypothetical protein
VLPTKFQLIWPNGFREDFLIGQSQKRTAYGGHSPLKLLSRMNQNFVGSIYGNSSIKFHHFNQLDKKHGRHGQFLIG